MGAGTPAGTLPEQGGPCIGSFAEGVKQWRLRDRLTFTGRLPPLCPACDLLHPRCVWPTFLCVGALSLGPPPNWGVVSSRSVEPGQWGAGTQVMPREGLPGVGLASGVCQEEASRLTEGAGGVLWAHAWPPLKCVPRPLCPHTLFFKGGGSERTG